MREPIIRMAARTVAGACFTLTWHIACADILPATSRQDTIVTTTRHDSIRTLPTIVVRAKRPERQETLDALPGQATAVELAPLRDRITTTSEVLAHVPGVHVSDYGSLGMFSTVSIRGSGASQVNIYLDGVPLARAGLGVTNLADLPFAGLDRVEVYSSSTPAELPGASLGGAINLISRGANPHGPPGHRAAFLLGTGSFATRRVGLSQEFVHSGWSGLLVADHMESEGNFSFYDDNGTPLELGDDEVVPRRNNWLRADEILVRVARGLPHHGELHVLDQWVRREQGVPGIASFQSTRARGSGTWNVASIEARVPSLASGWLGATGRVFDEWRRDTFSDPASEIGLGYQDNRDTTHNLGAHAGLDLRLPAAQLAAAHFEVRREGFIPLRRYPHEQRGPEQTRQVLELGLEDRILLANRLTFEGGLRVTRSNDVFVGNLRTPYSQRPARSGQSRWVEPRAGARLQIWRGLAIRGTYGEYHRAPGFLELFGDGGSVAGSSDLVAEEGTNRDVGLQWTGTRNSVQGRMSVAHFDNHVTHLITFLPQSQRTFVARNIGAARLQGEEFGWRLADASPTVRWTFEGSFTRLDASDLGVDVTWYAGKTLPGRPARQLWQRVGLHLGRFDLGYEYEHVGDNYLERWNRDVVRRRDLHGIDAHCGWRGIGVTAELRNLTDEHAVDVGAFPLPGRTFFLSTSYKR